MRTTISGALLAALILNTPVSAAEPLPAHFEACVSLRRDSERLACYDKAVAIMQADGQTAPPPSAENMFGANSENGQKSDSNAKVKREELQQISGIVTSLRHMDDGMIQLELDNGQVWRQQDAEVRLLVEAGDKITVARASMGTFRIADKTGRFARFKRVR